METKEVNIHKLICRVDDFKDKNISSLYSDIITMDLLQGQIVIKDSREISHIVSVSDRKVHIEEMI